MAKLTRGDLSRARAAVAELAAALRRWRSIDELRDTLPARYRRMIPPSRRSVVVALVRDLQRRGAVEATSADLRGFGEDFGAWQIPVVVGGIVLVAGAAAVAVVVAAMPRIQAEGRASRQAEAAAQAARRAWLAERAQSMEIGPERARELAAQRAGETASYLAPPGLPSLPAAGEMAPPADLVPPGDDGGAGPLGLPGWVLPVGLVVIGAGAAFALSRR